MKMQKIFVLLATGWSIVDVMLICLILATTNIPVFSSIRDAVIGILIIEAIMFIACPLMVKAIRKDDKELAALDKRWDDERKSHLIANNGEDTSATNDEKKTEDVS